MHSSAAVCWESFLVVALKLYCGAKNWTWDLGLRQVLYYWALSPPTSSLAVSVRHWGNTSDAINSHEPRGLLFQPQCESPETHIGWKVFSLSLYFSKNCLTWNQLWLFSKIKSCRNYSSWSSPPKWLAFLSSRTGEEEVSKKRRLSSHLLFLFSWGSLYVPF